MNTISSGTPIGDTEYKTSGTPNEGKAKMNKTDRERLNELEIFALDKFCDYNNISVRDYINADVMGLLKYQEYIELYKEEFGHCFECNTSPCDEGCPYQVDKGNKNE